MIVCIGWGSLIWCQKQLPVEGKWQVDGPELPIEFARESRDKRITLVIAEGAPTVTTLWAAPHRGTAHSPRALQSAAPAIIGKYSNYKIGIVGMVS